MSRNAKAQLNRHLDRAEKKLPRRPAAMLRHVRKTAAFYARWTAALALIAGVLLGFLPILGFWMLPLGFILIAQDVPILRRPLARLLNFIERQWAGVENAVMGARAARYFAASPLSAQRRRKSSSTF